MTQFIPVESSNINAIGFDPHKDDETLGVLSVRFKSGAEFQYFDVPAEKFDNFLDAESKGKFYIANVKGAYDHQCVVAGTPAKPRANAKVKLAEHCPIVIRTGNIDL